MEHTPLISAITIFRNAERFIEEAIRSVLAQTYTHWELLLVDDGSTDRSTAVALRFAVGLPERVFYLEHPGHANRGMSASRNLGVARAHGDLVAFLDADDTWLPHKLERQVALLRQHSSASMVCGPTVWWRNWENLCRSREPDRLRELGVAPDTLVAPPELLVALPLDHIKTPATCSVLLRREVFLEIGGFEEEFPGMYEDQAFFAKLFLKRAVFVTSEALDRYRQHPHSCCAVARRRHQYHPRNPNAAHAQFLFWLEEYLAKEGVEHAELRRNLARALWPYRHPLRFRLAQWCREIRRRVKNAAAHWAEMIRSSDP